MPADFYAAVALKEVKTILTFCGPFVNKYHPFALDTALALPLTPAKMSDPANCQRFARILRDHIVSTADFAERVVGSVATDHGAPSSHPDIDHLMIRLGNSVDVPETVHSMEQLGALHLALVAARNRTCRQHDLKLIEPIGKILHPLERERERGE